MIHLIICPFCGTTNTMEMTAQAIQKGQTAQPFNCQNADCELNQSSIKARTPSSSLHFMVAVQGGLQEVGGVKVVKEIPVGTAIHRLKKDSPWKFIDGKKVKTRLCRIPA